MYRKTCWPAETQQTNMCDLYVQEDSLASRDPADKHVRSICTGRLAGQPRPSRETCAIYMYRKTHWPAETRQTDRCQLHVEEDSLASRDPADRHVPATCWGRLTGQQRPPADQVLWSSAGIAEDSSTGLFLWSANNKKKKKNQLHKNSTASKASTSSLTKELEAATHAFLKRWQPDRICYHLHRFTASACCIEWKAEWKAQTGTCQCLTSTCKDSCRCFVLDTLQWNDQVDRLAGKAAITGHLHLRRY